MPRFFNTTGPINPQDHYCLSSLERIKLVEILPLIEQKKYFVLHAPRQTGKTSCLLALMNYLNTQDQYCCVYINVELAQAAREDVAGAMRGKTLCAHGNGARQNHHRVGHVTAAGTGSLFRMEGSPRSWIALCCTQATVTDGG